MQGADFRLRELRAQRARLAEVQESTQDQESISSKGHQLQAETGLVEQHGQVPTLREETNAEFAVPVQTTQPSQQVLPVSQPRPSALEVNKGWVKDEAVASAALRQGSQTRNADQVLASGLQKACIGKGLVSSEDISGQFQTEKTSITVESPRLEHAEQQVEHAEKQVAVALAESDATDVEAGVPGPSMHGQGQHVRRVTFEEALPNTSVAAGEEDGMPNTSAVVGDEDGHEGTETEGTIEGTIESSAGMIHSKGELHGECRGKSKKKQKRKHKQRLDLEEFGKSPVMTKLKQMIQKDPSALQYVLESLSETNPKIVEELAKRQKEFLDMLLGSESQSGTHGSASQETEAEDETTQVKSELTASAQELAGAVQEKGTQKNTMSRAARERQRLEKALKPLTTSTHPLAVAHSAYSCAVCKTVDNLLLCSACKCVRFCSRDHQRQFKERHKTVCKFLANCRGGLLQELSQKDWFTEAFKKLVEVFMQVQEGRDLDVFEYQQLLHIPRCRKCGKMPATVICQRSHAAAYCSEVCWNADKEWRESWQCEQLADTQAAARLLHEAGGGIPFNVGNTADLLPDTVYENGWHSYVEYCKPCCGETPFLKLDKTPQQILIDELSYPMAVLSALHKAGRPLHTLCAGCDRLEVHMLMPELAAVADMEKYMEWLYRAGPQVNSLTIRIVGTSFALEEGRNRHTRKIKVLKDGLSTPYGTIHIHYYQMLCHEWLDKVAEVQNQKKNHVVLPESMLDTEAYDDICDPIFRVCYSPEFDLWPVGDPKDHWGPVLDRLAATDDGIPLIVSERSFIQVRSDTERAQEHGLRTVLEPQFSDFASCLTVRDDYHSIDDNPLGLLIWNMGHSVLEGHGQCIEEVADLVADDASAAWNLVDEADLQAAVDCAEFQIVNAENLGREISVCQTEGAETILFSRHGPWSFDGTTFEDMPYSIDANPEGSFSVQLHVKSIGGQGFRSPLTSRDDKPCAGYMFYVDADEHWCFWVGDDSSQYWAGITGPQVNMHVWTSLRGVVDLQRGEVKFYVDNVLAGARVGVKYVPNRQRPLRLGAGRSERSSPLFRFIGEVRHVIVRSQEGLALPESAKEITVGFEE